ncbi:MAG TPA: CorA family divalent cation transporter [Polyangiaceae bacterium]|nr:CorA family divalent cation transporter [Polyangiaceae bacterium]
MQQRLDSLVADSRGLICAFGLAPLARLERDALDSLDPERPLWLHFNLADGRARDWLREDAHLPVAAREALLEDDAHVHVQIVEQGFVAVLRDLVREGHGGEARYASFAVYMDARRLISVRRNPLETFDRLRHELGKGLDLPSPVALFEHLVECLADTFEGVVERLASVVEEAEDAILAGHSEDRGTELRRVRWLLARLRREARANRSALSRLPSHLPAGGGPERQQSLGAAIDRFAGVARDLELVEDRARLMQEEIAGRLGESTNRNLYLLSVVTTAMLPVTLVTGVFGMNVGGMPWTQDPHGFSHMLFMMALVLAVTLALIGRARMR